MCTPKPGPYQAAAGLPRVGLHLLPVFLGLLDDVFVGHAWGGRERTCCPWRSSARRGGNLRGAGATQAPPASARPPAVPGEGQTWILRAGPLPESRASVMFRKHRLPPPRGSPPGGAPLFPPAGLPRRSLPRPAPPEYCCSSQTLSSMKLWAKWQLSSRRQP